MIDQWTCLKRGNTKISLCSSGSSVLVCQRMGRHHELHTEWAGNSHGICGQKTWTVQIPALILLNSHGSRLSPRNRSPRGAMWFDSLVAKAHRKKQTTPQGDNDFVMLHDVEQMLLESNVEHIGTIFAIIIINHSTHRLPRARKRLLKPIAFPKIREVSDSWNKATT